MNIADVRTYQTIHGHVGEFRLAWRSDFYPVREAGDDSPIQYFPSRKDAELAAWRAMNQIEQKAMVRGGEKLSARAAADALFKLPAVIKQKGRERRIEVTRKGEQA